MFRAAPNYRLRGENEDRSGHVTLERFSLPVQTTVKTKFIDMQIIMQMKKKTAANEAEMINSMRIL